MERRKCNCFFEFASMDDFSSKIEKKLRVTETLIITSCVLSSAVPVIARTGVSRINLTNLARKNFMLLLCISIQRR